VRTILARRLDNSTEAEGANRCIDYGLEQALHWIAAASTGTRLGHSGLWGPRWIVGVQASPVRMSHIRLPEGVPGISGRIRFVPKPRSLYESLPTSCCRHRLAKRSTRQNASSWQPLYHRETPATFARRATVPSLLTFTVMPASWARFVATTCQLQFRQR